MRTRSFRSARNCAPPRRGLNSLEAIVAHYLERYASGSEEEIQYFRELASLRAAITAAASAKKPNGKRYEHQYRIPRAVLERVETELQHVRSALRSAESFQDLHQIVDEAIRPIHGVGPL